MDESARVDTSLGLVAVDTASLHTLLRGVHRQTLACPLTPAGLAGHGLQDQSGPILALLRGLPAAAVHATVVAVIAERRAAQARADGG